MMARSRTQTGSKMVSYLSWQMRTKKCIWKMSELLLDLKQRQSVHCRAFTLLYGFPNLRPGQNLPLPDLTPALILILALPPEFSFALNLTKKLSKYQKYLHLKSSPQKIISLLKTHHIPQLVLTQWSESHLG